MSIPTSLSDLFVTSSPRLPTQEPVAAVPLTSAATRLKHHWASVVLAAVFALAALAVGPLIPAVLPANVLEEGGLVESSTVFLYLAAVACVTMTRLPGLRSVDKVALCIVLLSLAAREADLHKAMFGISILKTRFYNRYGSAEQVLLALLTLAPTVLSLLWLIRRGARRWWGALGLRRAPALTVMTFFVIILLAKVFDRMPVTLIGMGLMSSVPSTLGILLESFEEIFEMMLPLLVMLAVTQSALIKASTTSHDAGGARDWSVRVHIRHNCQNRYEPHIELEAQWRGNRLSCMIPPAADFDTPEAGTAHALEWVATWQRLNGKGRLD
jgi:hypothetical protein